MTDQTEHEYFAERAVAQYRMSCNAADSAARAAHAHLTTLYVEIAATYLEEVTPPRHPGLRIGA